MPSSDTLAIRPSLSFEPWVYTLHMSYTDITDILRGRLDEYEAAWNSGNYQALENFYAEDSVFVPAGADIRRGNDGM